ncbi:MAG: hypothetical protein P4M11_10125 [Candidatus Pacebacteria bacterium]|nr:hypothetical protein [Candidatus Paceibacterota bacterium]
MARPVVSFLLLILARLAASEFINYGDDSEDDYISYANISLSASPAVGVPMYDTIINYDSVIFHANA